MASAHQLPLAQDRCIREGFYQTPDPGSAGTIAIVNKAFAICALTTAGAENRALPAAGGFGVGTRLLVYGTNLVGVATITGAGNGSVVLNADGDGAEFVVVEDGGVKEWQVIGNTSANKLNLSTAPIALGTWAVGDGADALDETDSANLVVLLDGLKALGIVSGTFTDANA